MAATCTSSFLGTSLSARPRTAAPAGEPFDVIDRLGASTSVAKCRVRAAQRPEHGLGGACFTGDTTAETKPVGCAMVSAERFKSIRHFSLSLAIWVHDLRYASQHVSVSLAHLVTSVTGC